ncbi:hypothetical protein LTR66_003906, partial [Elasticomyces elasticus]
SHTLLTSLTSPDRNNTHTHTPAFPALLFNLATVYELCTERARDAKVRLVERLASAPPGGGGGGGGAGYRWEREGAEFKL